MAKRKQQPADKQTLIATRPAEIAQAFNEGDLKRFYDEWHKLCNRLADSPNLLAQAEHDIAFAITDEGTPEASRLGAFREVVKVNPYELTDYGVLNNTGTRLDDLEHYHAAIVKYEQALKYKPNEPILLNNYGVTLETLGRYEDAIVKYKQALVFNPDFGLCLKNYGDALAALKQYNEATIKYEQALKLEPDFAECWFNYGNALGELERYDEAIIKYEQALKLEPNYPSCLNNYGNVLGDLGRHEEAITRYEQALQLKPDYPNCLNNYGNALGELEQYEESIIKFNQALQLEPDNCMVLNNYGNTLRNLGRHDEAIEKYEQALNIEPKLIQLYLNYGLAFMEVHRYKEAIAKFEYALNVPKREEFANIIYLNLGSLYYRTQQEMQAKHYFDKLLEISDDKDKQKIKIAQEMFTINHDSDEAFDLLNEIVETSPDYQEANQLFGRRAAGKRYFDKFKTSNDDIRVKDTQALNRSMYHKIANEVAILKELAFEVVADYPAQNALLQRVMASINNVLQGVKQRREAEKAKVQAIQSDNYGQILQAIEQTAHDVSDFVNNELAIVEEEIRFALDDDPDAPQAALSELLGQIKTTQAALNDLKAINEGIHIKYSRFPVSELFEVWLHKTHFAQATLSVDLTNGESIFYGDKAKLKSMLNEWVENSLRHNPNKADLTLHMAARDEVGPPKRLVITYQDNGQGIPSDHKAKIFLPLFTTSTVGSGLGLFIIKRTINQMHGEIVEKGEHGVMFEVTIPYTPGESL